MIFWLDLQLISQRKQRLQLSLFLPLHRLQKVANTVPSLKGQVPTLAALTLGKPLLDKEVRVKSIYDVVNTISDFVTPAATLPAAETLSSIGGLPAASAAPGSVLELLSATSQVSLLFTMH